MPVHNVKCMFIKLEIKACSNFKSDNTGVFENLAKRSHEPCE